NTEFINGRLTTMRGTSRLLMSTTETRSLPGGRSWTLPVSSHVTFSSMPTIMYWGPGTTDAVVVHADRARPATNMSPRAHEPPVPTPRCAVLGILLGCASWHHGRGSAIASRSGD